MRSRSATWIARWFLLAGACYLLAGVGAVIILSPRVPYADAWQHYANLLATPFPASVFAADNGHPELFANLVRLASLRWLHGSEVPQIAIGLVLALAVLAMLLALPGRSSLPRPRGAAIGCVFVLGVFWLGNARALVHDNESLHVYSVLAFALTAISILLRPASGTPVPAARMTMASLACVAAAFSFGSGTAAFVAVGAILFVRRASPRSWLILVAALAVTLVLYRLLPGSAGVPLAFHPLAQVGLALHWIASPLVYLVWPLVDPAAAAALPTPFGTLGVVARAWTAVAGDVHASTLPQALAGGAFVACLLGMTLGARRDPAGMPAVGCAGLALAWFGVAVAVLVALTRTGYFLGHPDQIQAPRYLPWSTLAWAGLLAAALARRNALRGVLAVVALLPVLALSAEGGMVIAMHHQREVADDVALAAVVGVWPDRAEGGETDPEVTRLAAQQMRVLRVGPFAWPEAVLMGEPLPVEARPVAIAALAATPVAGGARIDAQLGPVPCHAAHLLVAEDGGVIGLLRPFGENWRGIVREARGLDHATVHALCD